MEISFPRIHTSIYLGTGSVLVAMLKLAVNGFCAALEFCGIRNASDAMFAIFQFLTTRFDFMN